MHQHTHNCTDLVKRAKTTYYVQLRPFHVICPVRREAGRGREVGGMALVAWWLSGDANTVMRTFPPVLYFAGSW